MNRPVLNLGLFVGLLAALSLGLGACGTAEKKDDQTAAGKTADDTNGGTGKDPTKTKKSTTPSEKDDSKTHATDAADGATTDGATADGGKTDGTADGATDGATDGAADGGGGPASGQAYFTDVVVPMLQVQCVGCHADPRIPVEVRAPLTIYSYKAMQTLLASGKGSESNDFHDKVRNLVAHTGGDRCSKGITESPCKEVLAWWHAEFGDDTGPAKIGRINEVTSLGKVYGYAFDPADTTKFVTVTLYSDGPKGTGKAAGTMTANAGGSDNNTPGDHAFVGTLPSALLDGKAHDLYAYATIDSVETALSDTATKFTAYAFSAAGRNYYEANVKGQMGTCQACHVISYEQQFYSLIAPSPAQGGTALDNQLIDKPSQTNGVAHGGGLKCATANSSPCSVFQAWWKVEFGG